jgi:hypothetical protein
MAQDLVPLESKVLGDALGPIQDALREANGSMHLAAHKLGCRVNELDRVIRLSKTLPKFFHALKRVNDEKYMRASLTAIENEIVRKTAIYRSEAQDEIYKLATMKISENSAQNQVKLLAAVKLYENGQTSMGQEISGVLAALNDSYHQHAPRIRSVRERVIEFENEPQVIEASADAPE